MRIIAGSAGGRRFKAPLGPNTRPTSDRVRESLFSILGGASDLRVLDLFAGSGGLGLEALSRGAKRVVFCDQDQAALKTLKENLRDLGMSQEAEVVRSDSLALLRRLSKASRQFDWIFIDPPYASELAEQVLQQVGENKLLHIDGQLIVEHDKRMTLLEQIGSLQRTDTRRYGDTCVSFFEHEKIPA
ncbi:MAG: 16S rRNA (guanine(966)-N(2))-methyltransferase RsmD [Kofleriaceae bacterium]|nr:16S rRNA (guanine(966)-N(2))-methyltransferase RsmD [Kofleriaceae bacterium]